MLGLYQLIARGVPSEVCRSGPCPIILPPPQLLIAIGCGVLGFILIVGGMVAAYASRKYDSCGGSRPHFLKRPTSYFFAGLIFWASIFALGALPRELFYTNLYKGVEAYNQRNWVDARKILSPLADDGDVFAQVVLGEMYASVKEIKSDELSIKYFLMAAKQGDQYAIERLGFTDKNRR